MGPQRAGCCVIGSQRDRADPAPDPADPVDSEDRFGTLQLGLWPEVGRAAAAFRLSPPRVIELRMLGWHPNAVGSNPTTPNPGTPTSGGGGGGGGGFGSGGGGGGGRRGISALRIVDVYAAISHSGPTCTVRLVSMSSPALPIRNPRAAAAGAAGASATGASAALPDICLQLSVGRLSLCLWEQLDPSSAWDPRRPIPQTSAGGKPDRPLRPLQGPLLHLIAERLTVDARRTAQPPPLPEAIIAKLTAAGAGGTALSLHVSAYDVQGDTWMAGGACGVVLSADSIPIPTAHAGGGRRAAQVDWIGWDRVGSDEIGSVGRHREGGV